MSIKKTIARSIRKADKSYFFENYDKQAAAVLKGLEKDGYCIMPLEPDEDLLLEVADTISTGKMRPEQHIRNVWQTLAKRIKKDY
ncbi:MAG: hypothetical protein MRY32_07455 [Rickettsiales bacterium]|nr:hypothetical protein [Rickettsiales bacterium]